MKKKKKLKTNYRLVTILQTVSKIYEWCLYEQIDEYFQPLFSKLQCSFRKGHSAQHCLLVLIKECCKVLDIRGFDGLLLTDLSKPFGCIDHELLIEKLHAYSFDIKLWRIQVVLETGIPVWVLKLWHLKNTFQFFFFQFHFNKKYVEVAISDFTMHLISLIWLRGQKYGQKRKTIKQKEVVAKE